MATALERNMETQRELNSLLEQAEGVRGSEPIIPGEPVSEQPTLTNVASEEATAPKADESTERDLSYWKQRALTSEGRYNTLKPKLDDTIHQLRLRVSALEQLNENLKGEIESLRIDPIKERLGNQDVINVLGEDTVNAISKSISDVRETVKAQLSEVKKEATTAKSDAAYSSFVFNTKRLAAESGADVDALNYDSKFHQFLDGNRSPKGHTYRTLFNEAVKNMDADSVSSFFIDYQAGVQKVEPNLSGLTEVRDSVMARMAPQSTPGNPVVANRAAGPRVTLAFINKFNQDLAKGLYKNRYTEMKDTQKLIEDAYSQNKIFDR